jgi:hypothetical protein
VAIEPDPAGIASTARPFRNVEAEGSSPFTSTPNVQVIRGLGPASTLPSGVPLRAATLGTSYVRAIRRWSISGKPCSSRST